MIVKSLKNAKKDYFYGLGRRKTSTARVRLYANKDSKFIVNDLELTKYFPSIHFQNQVLEPIKVAALLNKFSLSIKVAGGGISSQAEACRLGVARALLQFDPENKKVLRAHGLLTRDPRAKERKKPGLKRARRAPQWSKR